MPPGAPIRPEHTRKAVNAVVALEAEAGITTEAERARDVWLSFPDNDVPLYSAASIAEDKRERQLEHEAAGRRTRAVYFKVADLAMRRRLIAANRAVDAAHHLDAAEAVVTARRAVWVTVRTGGARPVPEMIGAALSAGLVWAAWTWAGAAIALAMIVFLAATLPGATLSLIARRDAEIRAAEDELRTVEDLAEEAYSRGYVFTKTEEWTGEPEPAARVVAARPG